MCRGVITVYGEPAHFCVCVWRCGDAVWRVVPATIRYTGDGRADRQPALLPSEREELGREIERGEGRTWLPWRLSERKIGESLGGGWRRRELGGKAGPLVAGVYSETSCFLPIKWVGGLLQHNPLPALPSFPPLSRDVCSICNSSTCKPL